MGLIRYTAHFTRSIFVSFLPPRYRKNWAYEHTPDFLKATIISGLLEFLVFILILTGEFYDEVHRGVPSMDRYSTDPGMVAALTAGLELFHGPEFLLNPFHLLAFYLFLEGIVRTLAAAATQESVGTLPLYVVGWIQDWIVSGWQLSALGPAIADEVLPGDKVTHDLCIRSCRRKKEWNSHITIRFREEFYMLTGEDAGFKPRPFVYRLRRNPSTRPVIVIREYHPENLN